MIFEVILKLLWASEGYFEVILRHLQKTFMFPTDFNDFILLCGQLGATLGSLGDYFGQLLGHLWVTLGL